LQELVSVSGKFESRITVEKTNSKELGEMGAVVEKMRKEAEKNEEMWTRDKNEWEAKMQALETLNKNINKKMNGNISNNKEVTNRLK